MTSKAKANQKAGAWKVVNLTVKAKFLKTVKGYAKSPGKKRLVIRQLISAGNPKGGKRLTVYHRYKVRPTLGEVLGDGIAKSVVE